MRSRSVGRRAGLPLGAPEFSSEKAMVLRVDKCQI